MKTASRGEDSVEIVMNLILEIHRSGTAIILVEQKLALGISQRVFVMGRGTIVFASTPGELEAVAANPTGRA